jgi:hypothetical protein
MHVSARVPWEDASWDGTVCKNPCGNTSCLVLPRIAEDKDDAFEAAIAGERWDAEGGRLPACATFMSPFGYRRSTTHPYSSRRDADGRLYAHFKRTTFQHAPYSAAVLPFAWMIKEGDGIPAKAKAHQLGFESRASPICPSNRSGCKSTRAPQSTGHARHHLVARGLGHHSAASRTPSSPASVLSSANSATRLRIPAACSVTEIPSGATSIRSINRRRGAPARPGKARPTPARAPRGHQSSRLPRAGRPQLRVLPTHRGDGPRDQLGRREQPTHLPEVEALHLASSDRAHRAAVVPWRV